MIGLTEARAALISADTIIPESAPWWELVCHREHGQGRYVSEEEAKTDLGCECDRESCRYLANRVVRVQVEARPRSLSVPADALRAALARIDELEAEANGGYRVLLRDCDDLIATALRAVEIGAFPGPSWRERAAAMRVLIAEVPRG